MGISTDGILAFGIDLGDDLPEEWQELEGIDSYLCKKAGYPEWRSGMTETEKKKYWAGRHEIIDASPVTLVAHCSFAQPQYILAVRGAYLSASRGYPEKIDMEALNVPKEKIAAFKEWCVLNDVEYQEPSWILCSIYG